MHYYEIAPNVIGRRGAPTYTYHFDTILSIGTIVHITVGSKPVHGVIVQEVPRPSYPTKAIVMVHDTPPLPTPLVQTAQWMADYYATPLPIVIQTLLPRGLDIARRQRSTAQHTPIRKRTNFVFNSEQSAAITTINQMTPGSAVLHGVTGSGKTAVYIELARTCIASGRSVVLLVPEIALTSQLVDELSHHFPDIMVTHSGQTEAARHVQWHNALCATTPHIAIGPRSALLLPLQDIGLIILDEYHEPSYKQDQAPRYYSPRVASVLASHHNAKVVLGSATPPVSEYFLADSHARPIIHMRQPARPVSKPQVDLIDMTKRAAFRNHHFFSDALLKAIETSIARGHQTLLFHNRRGSASITLCEQCGWIDSCERCAIPRTLHIDQHLLRCHVCDARATVPTACPSCGSADVIHRGIGTKRIEAELRSLFPDARIARFDGDSAADSTLDKCYAELYRGDIDIIIGTQVVAKGLDLPLLDTVGVIQADAGIALPDFIASERTFQLLCQVIGRVGRSDIQSHVIVQTYRPTDPAIVHGIKQEYAAFYDITLAQRRHDHYPPFVHLLKLTCSYKSEARAIQHTQELAARLRTKYRTAITILGPTPAFYERQRDYYRWQLLIKSTQRTILTKIISEDITTGKWQVDLDPLSLL